MDTHERRFISMLSDYGFKVTFGNEASGLSEESRSGLFDMACQDEQGRVFIVEMQLRNFKYFIHRAKFYALHKLNEFVAKGDYRFNDLPPIYVISILAGKTYKTKEYHQIGTIKNQHGEEIDNQITHIIVELGKFDLSRDKIKTDLDKLLYTMKTTDRASVLEPFNPPEFWDEEWMKAAVEELNLRAMTPQERFAYQKVLIKYRMATQETEELREAAAKAQEEAITKMLTSGLLTDEQIAEFQNVPLTLVQKIKQTL